MLSQALVAVLLVPSVIALLVLAAYRSTGLAFVFVLFVILAFLLSTGSATFLVCSLVLAVVVMVARSCGADPRRSARWFAGTAALVWLAAVALSAHRYRVYTELMDEYPLESIRDRLAYEQEPDAEAEETHDGLPTLGRSNRFATQLPATSEAIEEAVDDAQWEKGWERTGALMSLMAAHDHFVAEFISADGFGVGRTLKLPAKRKYVEIPEIETVPLPGPSEPDSSPSAEEESRPFQSLVDANVPGGPAYNSLETMHVDGVVDFVNPSGFGYVERVRTDDGYIVKGDRMIGFQPHAFRSVPAPAESDSSKARWSVERLELVSLLKHDPPAAYLSRNLPRMDELADAPTRRLDDFEQNALQRLHDGEGLVAGARTNEIRMLGAIRAVQPCLECHQVGRGTLLGAFSYRLRRSPELNEPVPRPIGEGPLSLNDRHGGMTFIARIMP